MMANVMEKNKTRVNEKEFLVRGRGRGCWLFYIELSRMVLLIKAFEQKLGGDKRASQVTK
jgi:hypothetical protein